MHVFKLTFFFVILSKFILGNSIIHFNNKILVFSEEKKIFQKVIKNRNIIDYNKFRFFEINGKKIYLNRVSGIVFERKEDSIFRIDKSYDDKMHTGSLDFVYNDTLFRFGGYGYFHTNKNLIYYNEIENEWDLIKYKNYEDIQPFSTVGFHYIKNNKLYVIGFDNNPNDLQQDQGFKSKGFVFDLLKKKVEGHFELNELFKPPSSYYQINQQYVFLFYPENRKLLILDLEDLNLYSYELSQAESRINNKFNDNFVLKNGILYYTIKDIFENINIGKLNIESIINNMKIAYSLKKNDLNYLPILLLLIIPFFIFFIKKALIKPKILILEKMNLKYGKESILLNSKMIEIVKCLLKNQIVPNNELNEFFYKHNQNLFHVNRKKNNCIDEINLIFKAKNNLDLILKKRNEFDKRMVEYYINPVLITPTS